MSFEKEGEIVVFVENKEDIPNISKNKYEQIVNFITQILQNSGYAVKTKKEMFSGGIKVQGRKNINVNGKTAGTLITYELKLHSDKLSLKHTAGVSISESGFNSGGLIGMGISMYRRHEMNKDIQPVKPQVTTEASAIYNQVMNFIANTPS